MSKIAVVSSLCLTLGVLSGAANALEITGVRSSALLLEDFAKEPLQVLHRVSESVVSELRIYDARDRLVFNTVGVDKVADEDRELIWNGQDLAGAPVPPGEYRFTLAATNADGETAVYDMTDLSGGRSFSAKKTAWNPATKTVDYELLKPGRVDIRIGMAQNGPLLKTLVKSVPRMDGKHSESWDGLDQTGVLKLAENPRLQIGVAATTLSANTVIVAGSGSIPQFIEPMSWESPSRKEAISATDRRRRSTLPDIGAEDVRVILNMPADNNKPISGKVSVGVDVADEDRAAIAERRFEAAFFVDGILVYENELGYVPMTWYWDTAGLNPGTHYLTVNLIGYEGNFGIDTRKVQIGATELTEP
jgi:hypothetical protein